MAKYLLLYSGGGQPPSGEAEQAAVMKAWTDWFTTLGSAVIDAGNPTGSAKSISSYGVVSDGPAGTFTSGYSILQAESLDGAVELARRCPHLGAGGEVSVYETFAM